MIIHGEEDGKIRGLNSEIPVKFGPYLGRGYFDHKFMIIDGRVAITGSLNWSGACMSHNLDDVLITSEDNIVANNLMSFGRNLVMRRLIKTCKLLKKCLWLSIKG